MLHEKDINELTEAFDDLGHATRHLDKHVRMVKIQCDQIAETQALILSQDDFDKTIFTNTVTRQDTKTKEPLGPPWYQEEQAWKARETQEMTQEE